VLAILTRIPFVFAPRRTIHFWMAIFSIDRSIRILGGVLGMLSLLLLMTDFGGDDAAQWPMWVLWGLLSIGLCLAVFSTFFRQYAQKKLQWADTKMSDGALRGVGVLAVSVGALLVYLGLYVV
jgi:uncharacterized protein YjeT (DUF2065 family)